MKEVWNVLAPVGIGVSIGSLILGVFCWISSFQFLTRREEMRKLRVALERDPTPSQLGQAATLWPDCGPYQGNMLKAEYTRRAGSEEHRRAHMAEKVKGWARTLFFVCAVFVAVTILSIVMKNQPDEPVKPKVTTEENL